MKRTIGWTAHAACLATILLAIWVPFGGRGQWIATAVVLLLLGAVLLGSPDRYAEGGEVGPVPHREGEILVGTGDDDLDERLNTRPTYGRKEK